MKIIYETSLSLYTTRREGKALLDRIIDEGKDTLLEAILEDLYPEGATEEQIDDLLAYEEDNICEWLGIPTEEQLQRLQGEWKIDLEELTEEYERVCDQIKALEDTIKNFPCTQTELDHYGKQLIDRQTRASDIDDDMKDIKEKLEDLEEELERIRSY